MKKAASALQSFEVEFQPFFEEINTKEGVIRECADAATMKRIKGMIIHLVWDSIGKRLTQAYRHGRCPSGYHARFSQVEWLVDISLYFHFIIHRSSAWAMMLLESYSGGGLIPGVLSH